MCAFSKFFFLTCGQNISPGKENKLLRSFTTLHEYIFFFFFFFYIKLFLGIQNRRLIKYYQRIIRNFFLFLYLLLYFYFLNQDRVIRIYSFLYRASILVSKYPFAKKSFISNDNSRNVNSITLFN